MKTQDRERTDFLFFPHSVATLRHSPDFELRAGGEVGRKLLDEREQHGLAEGARVLAKHLLRVDGLAHIQDQVQVSGRQRL